jgi:predicted nucleic acid-binding protein
MRFIDSNVFIHALFMPNRGLQDHEKEIKEAAKRIILRVEDGEEVTTTVVHVSEVANILEAKASNDAREILSTLTSLNNLRLLGVTGEAYSIAIQVSDITKLGINDTLAVNTMRDLGIKEVYSFDKDLDSIPEIKRIIK